MPNGYKHLSTEERDLLAVWKVEGVLPLDTFCYIPTRLGHSWVHTLNPNSLENAGKFTKYTTSHSHSHSHSVSSGMIIQTPP